MSSAASSSIDSQALANLDTTTRKEIVDWIEAENSKSKIHMCMSSIERFEYSIYLTNIENLTFLY